MFTVHICSKISATLGRSGRRFVERNVFFVPVFPPFRRFATFAAFTAIRDKMTGSKNALSALALLLLSLLFAACGKRTAGAGEGETRSVYYWNTVFRLDSAQHDFLRRYGVRRIYLRYFDVAEGKPNATLSFADSVPPGVEIVPTVFVMPDNLRGDTDWYARRIVERVAKMSQLNGVRGVKEMQIDCDWTRSTRAAFRRFMETVRAEARRRGWGVSVTIRLHQLAQDPPPADRGVLMLYNTGDVTDISCRKPILDPADVKPYLARLGSYKLPLAEAYPLFGWNVLFRGGRYVGIVHYEGEYPVLPTDSIVRRQPTLGDILATQREVRAVAGWKSRETIVYDLGSIKNFTRSDYEKIFGV